LVASPSGTVFAMDKDPQKAPGALELYRFETDGPIPVPPTELDETAYIGSQDMNLYAVNIPSGRVEWRYAAGSPVMRTPYATADDVYVTSERGGLARVDRRTGDPVWRVPRGRQV